MLEITIPKVGYGAEGVLTEWLVADGAKVEADQPLFLLETDKSEVEELAPAAGFVKFALEAGAEVEGGTVVGWIAATAEELASLGAGPAASSTESQRAPEAAAQTSTGPADSARRVSPNARRLAAELGVDLASVVGTGPDGQVRSEDVQAAESGAGGDARGEEIPLGGWRRSIANRLMRSMRETAHLTTIRDIDLTALTEYREKRKETSSGVPSLTAYLLKAAAVALRDFPELNGTLEDDVIHRPAGIHVSVAVETDRGVVTPVLRDADRRSPSDIGAFIAAKSVEARDARLSPEDVSGGSFTVTTTGPDGADWGTPILNHPQIAILLTGRVRDVLGLDGDRVVVRRVMGLSLTYDHRAVDGVPTVRYIARVEAICADPKGLEA